MAAYFFDTSALVKLYVEEAGSDIVDGLLSQNPEIIVSSVAAVEFASALARKLRAREITQTDAESVWQQFEQDCSETFRTRAVDGAVIASAIELAKSRLLRAYDAVQLASCVEANAARSIAGLESAIFVCADQELIRAAKNESVQCLSV